MISKTKARRILHEGKAQGKPITGKQRRFFGARASSYPMRYGNGGTVMDAYEKGTHEQLWDVWDVSQRTHFLIDHYDMLSAELGTDVTKYAQKFSHAPWKDLPKPIQQQVAIHHAMGFYDKGGQVSFTDPVLNKLLQENANELFSLDVDDTEMIFDEKTQRRFWVKRIASDKFIIEESGSLAKGKPASLLITSKQIMENGGIAKNTSMKYLPPSKKELLSKITSIKERMKNVKDEKTLAALNAHIKKLEDILNSKTSTQEKISKWKDDKKSKRLSRGKS